MHLRGGGRLGLGIRHALGRGGAGCRWQRGVVQSLYGTGYPASRKNHGGRWHGGANGQSCQDHSSVMVQARKSKAQSQASTREDGGDNVEESEDFSQYCEGGEICAESTTWSVERAVALILEEFATLEPVPTSLQSLCDYSKSLRNHLGGVGAAAFYSNSLVSQVDRLMLFLPDVRLNGKAFDRGTA